MSKLCLKPSPGKGIGIFTKKKIRKGELLFKLKEGRDYIYKHKKYVKKIRKKHRKFICYSGNKIIVPVDLNFSDLHIEWYLNHSFKPNIIEKVTKKKPEITSAYAIKKIKRNKELLIDYTTICDRPFDDF